MKSVKELAEILNVSQPTIYNHLKKDNEELQNHIVKKKGVIHLADSGIKELKISLGILKEIDLDEEDEEIKELEDEGLVIQEKGLEVILEDMSSRIAYMNEEQVGLIEGLNELKKQNEDIKEQNKILIKLITESKNQTFWNKLKAL